MELNIDTEQQAAVSILFSCVMQNGNISEQEIEQLSKAVVLCSKFRGFELNELTRNAISLQASHNPKDILEHCAGFISEDFRETLFAMVSEVILMDGHIDDEKTKTFAMLALYLNIPMERMKMILATYLIRNKWNVQVVDTSDN